MTQSLFLTPSAATAIPAAPGGAVPVAVNPRTGEGAGKAVGDLAQDGARSLAGGAVPGDLNSFLQALQRSAVPWTPGLDGAAAAPTGAGDDLPDGGEGVDAGPQHADPALATALPSWWTATLVPVATPVVFTEPGADMPATSGLGAAGPVAALPPAAAAESGTVPDLAASAATADVLAAGHAVAYKTAPVVVLDPVAAQAQPAPAAGQAGQAITQEVPAQGAAKPAGFTLQSPAGAPEALLGGSALGPEAAAVRERSTLGGLEKYVSDSNTLAMGAPGPASPAHPTAMGTAAAAPAGSAPSAWLDALGDRIETQLQRGSERTVIRLDPPMQGQLEITVRRDAGAIQVHLSASNADVVRQLQAISDGLRQELGVRQAGDVSVVVSQHGAREGDARGGSGERTPQQAGTPGQALAEAQDGHEPERFTLAALSNTNH